MEPQPYFLIFPSSSLSFHRMYTKPQPSQQPLPSTLLNTNHTIFVHPDNREDAEMLSGAFLGTLGLNEKVDGICFVVRFFASTEK